MGVENYWPWGPSVGDLNADGWEDVFIASGMGFPFRYGLNSLLLNDAGERFRDDSHLYADVLDLFGQGSLFELLSIARTRTGEAKLAGRAIAVPNDDPDDDSHAFRIDVDEVVFTHLNDAGNRLVIESWHPGKDVEVVERA